jgi:hypothetical protein
MGSAVERPPPLEVAAQSRTAQRANRNLDAEARRLDQKLDRELEDTFPASDPLPWTHEVN